MQLQDFDCTSSTCKGWNNVCIQRVMQKIAAQMSVVYQNALHMTTVRHHEALFPLHTNYAISTNFG